MGEIIFCIVLAVLSVLGFAQTLTYEITSLDASGGPALFPQIVLGCLFICVVVRLIQLLRQKQRVPFVFVDLFTGSRGIFLLAFALYAVGIPTLGFIIATIVYLNFICNYMLWTAKGTLGKKSAIAIRFGWFVVATFAINWFFASILNVMVPIGIFGI